MFAEKIVAHVDVHDEENPPNRPNRLHDRREQEEIGGLQRGQARRIVSRGIYTWRGNASRAGKIREGSRRVDRSGVACASARDDDPTERYHARLRSDDAFRDIEHAFESPIVRFD